MSDATPLLLENEVRAYVASLDRAQPTTKDEVRRVLLDRKLETLLAHRKTLKTHERRAISLMKRVEYDRIDPQLVFCNPDDLPLWKYVRMIVSSAPFLGRPGRANFMFCVDRLSGGLLGVLEIGSDVQSLGPRDKHIGWTKERKYGGGLNHLGNVGTCVAVQPFGLLTGGKFMIEATLSSDVVSAWKHQYGNVMAGVVVTSLFGRSSTYNRLPSFAYLGDTQGLGTAHVDAAGAKLLKAFARENNILSRSGGVGIRMDNKSDLLERACAVLKIDRTSVASHQPRGVYFAQTGPDALPFLRGELPEGDAGFLPHEVDQADVAAWWADRWYAMRWPKVRADVAAFDFDAYRVDSVIEAIRR